MVDERSIENSQVSIDFSCRVCGVQCDIAPNPPDRAVCPDHCEDHDYQYDPDVHEKRCIHCDKSEPEDWR